MMFIGAELPDNAVAIEDEDMEKQRLSAKNIKIEMEMQQWKHMPPPIYKIQKKIAVATYEER